MFNALRGLFRGPRHSGQSHASVVDLGELPEAVYAIGDVHGCRHHLRAMMTAIRADAAGLERQPLAVLLGDVVDRGHETAGVLDDIMSPNWPLIAGVLGNHEQMMLDFFHDPRKGSDWLLHGGFETLRSYGLSLSRDEIRKTPLRRIRQILQAHVPDEHIAWLCSLPHAIKLRMNDLTFFLAHAGYEVDRPETEQSKAALLWGVEAGTLGAGVRIIQGHLTVDKVDTDSLRIFADTGAWRTGVLSAVRLCPGIPPSVLSVRQPLRPPAML